MRETFRVSIRLLLLLGITLPTVAWLRIRARFFGPCPHVATKRGRSWARRTVRALGVQLEVRGKVPEGPVLLLANHRSYVDIPALLSQLPCVFLAKAEIASWPVFGAAARLQHTVFVQRENKASRRAARQSALETIRRELPFAAFPEGTTFRGPGLLPFFPGLFQLAEEHRIPVVPVAIEYGDPSDAWVDDEDFLAHFWSCFRKERLHAALVFGPVLAPEDAFRMKARAEAWIRDQLDALAPRWAPHAPDTRPVPIDVPEAAVTAA